GALARRATLGWIVQRLRRTELAFATPRRGKLGTTVTRSRSARIRGGLPWAQASHGELKFALRSPPLELDFHRTDRSVTNSAERYGSPRKASMAIRGETHPFGPREGHR